MACTGKAGEIPLIYDYRNLATPADIEADLCIIGAGALVTQNSNIPDGSLAFGNPARIIRKLTEEEIAGNKGNADRYVQAARAQLPQK